jgi:precorrin-6B methylase 2
MLFNISVSTGSQISNRLKSLSNLTKRALKNEEIKEEEVDDVISGYSSPDLVFTEGGIEDTLEEEP